MTDQRRAFHDAFFADEDRRAREYFGGHDGGRSTLMTDRQLRFVEAFVSGPPGTRWNASRAAEAVEYKWPAKQGPRLLSFLYVDEAVGAAFKAIHPEAAAIELHAGKS